YPDVIVTAEFMEEKLRLHIIDGSFLDVWFSEAIPGRWAYHWERRHIDGTIYRHDNRPHRSLRHLRTYPKHFHAGSDERVEESYLSDEPEQALRQFLSFIRDKLRGGETGD
ncbi:hypothetical protein DRO33_06400, partial [Candidatus Bathyarchaeota archaeon]